MNPFQIRDTYELIGVVEQIKPEASYLTEMFFPNVQPVSYSNYVSVEYRKMGRVLAPHVVKNAQGVNVGRVGSTIANYKAPMFAPRRIIGLDDIEMRQFGEQPIFSAISPAERAAKMQADDLTELLRLIENRKNKMAADILQTGKSTIKGYADDGQTVAIDLVSFEWDGLIEPGVKWNNANAKIFGDLKDACERIQENSGYIPTLMIIGKNVESYLLNNTELYKWLSIPNRENLNMMSFNPQYQTPQVRFIGYLSSLNLEIYSYSETYTDDDGTVKPFINPDAVIIGNPKRGKQIYGAVNYLDMSGNWQSAAANYVPVYSFDTNAQQTALTIYSRFLLVPEVTDDWVCLKVK